MLLKNSPQSDPLTCQTEAFLQLLQGKESPIATSDQALAVMVCIDQIQDRCKNDVMIETC